MDVVREGSLTTSFSYDAVTPAKLKKVENFLAEPLQKSKGFFPSIKNV